VLNFSKKGSNKLVQNQNELLSRQFPASVVSQAKRHFPPVIQTQLFLFDFERLSAEK